MGQTLERLSETEIGKETIFNNRFVVELCEKVHVHYRNLRILMSLRDYIEMARGMADSLKRWESRGKPEPHKDSHIELCRKEIAKNPESPGIIQINLNRNLYEIHEGQIFAEGAGLGDQTYIHLKLNDLRFELPLCDFLKFSDAVLKAKESLCSQEQLS